MGAFTFGLAVITTPVWFPLLVSGYVVGGVVGGAVFVPYMCIEDKKYRKDVKTWEKQVQQERERLGTEPSSQWKEDIKTKRQKYREGLQEHSRQLVLQGRHPITGKPLE